MDEFDFTEDEIRDQLEVLGYKDVPNERLMEFKRDLEQLVKSERSKNSSLFSTTEQSSSDSEVSRNGVKVNGASFGVRHNQGLRNGVNTNSQNDHVKYGKENIYKAPVQEVSGAVYRLPIQPSGQCPQGAVSHQRDVSTFGADAGFRVANGYTHGTDTQATDETLDTTATSDRRVVKRKVLRKRGGERQIYDESITESESDDLSSLEDRLRNLPLSIERDRPSTAPSSRGRHPDSVPRRPASARDAPAYRLPDGFEGPKALIRPMSTEPHKQNIRKSDPVARYQLYRTSWQSHRAPGEKQHKNLRWNVREHMLHHDEVVQKKPSKVYVPNSYQIPSDKKRKDLRWQIRNDLATGVVTPSMFD